MEWDRGPTAHTHIFPDLVPPWMLYLFYLCIRPTATSVIHIAVGRAETAYPQGSDCIFIDHEARETIRLVASVRPCICFSVCLSPAVKTR